VSGEGGWWVGLCCRLCGERVKADNGKFSRLVNEDGSFGAPVAEHHAGDCEREAREE
jgi:hypothetical protein